MKTLSLWRHAKSERGDADRPDHDRRLNARGRRDAADMAARLSRQVGRPDLVYASTARRTRESAAALLECGTDTPTIEYLDLLYLADVQTLLDAFARAPADIEHLLVIGHNPGLAECATRLAPSIDHYLPTAALVVLRHDGDDFDLRHGAATELLLHDWPKRD